MTYGRALQLARVLQPDGEDVSHPAELVRGDFGGRSEGPLIRPFGPPSPQGEKGRMRRAWCANNGPSPLGGEDARP